jgi:hypothetical protein
MKYGRVDDTDGIDFGIPADDTGTGRILANASEADSLLLLVVPNGAGTT